MQVRLLGTAGRLHLGSGMWAWGPRLPQGPDVPPPGRGQWRGLMMLAPGGPGRGPHAYPVACLERILSMGMCEAPRQDSGRKRRGLPWKRWSVRAAGRCRGLHTGGTSVREFELTGSPGEASTWPW